MRYLVIFLLSMLFISCSSKISNNREVYEVENVNALKQTDVNVIKVHYQNGNLAVLNDWIINENEKLIRGKGKLYNSKRELIEIKPITSDSYTYKSFNYSGDYFKIPFDDCVLIETNEYKGFNVISPLLFTYSTLISGISVYCIIDPKACFGSCPTFYLYEDEDKVLKAEGFSSSITKSMEATDIDFLTDYSGESKEVKIELMNEAYETHYVRNADILIIDKNKDENVYFGQDKFFITSKVTPPIRVNDNDNYLLDLLKENDNKEYLPLSDSLDLNTKYEIIVDFDEMDASKTGVVISQRQSFMTTFLFYQSMAYMGTKTGELLAKYERSSPMVRNAYRSINDVLGGVEVSVLLDNRWYKIGELKEQGPIVCDTHILPVNLKGKVSRVKLSMTKGLWRINQVGLCTIYRNAKPELIQAHSLLSYGQEDCEVLEKLNDEHEMIVNLPGTSYTLIYSLPELKQYALFLKTRGYYTEWMRKSWLEEEDSDMVSMIMYQPKKWLKEMAPKFKNVEPEMEVMFWSSKFAHD